MQATSSRLAQLLPLARRACSTTPRLSTLGFPKVDPIAIISDSQVKQFNEDGAIVLRSACGPERVQALQKMAEANLQSPGPLCDEHAAVQGSGGRFHDDQFLWHRWDVGREYVLESGMGAVAARAMRSLTSHILYDQLFVKEPGTASPTPWHNDTSYWHLSGKQIASIWLALDDVPRERGLSYVKGSHLRPFFHRVGNFSGFDSERNFYTNPSDLPPVPDVDARVASGEYELLSWDMVPGDALIFYSSMLHGAPGNPPNSPHRRRGYATRWCGDDVVFDNRAGTMHAGWKKHGFDNKLAQGEGIGCELHPNVVPMA